MAQGFDLQPSHVITQVYGKMRRYVLYIAIQQKQIL